MKILGIILFCFLSSGLAYSQEASSLKVQDNRDIVNTPSFLKKSIRADFKKSANIGTPGTGVYSTNITIAPWIDATGGFNHQLNFNNNGIYYRQGDINQIVWGEWSRLLFTDSFGTLGSNIRLGRVGESGNKNVDKGAQTIQYNIDFTGYRDIRADQIGARISGIRYNIHNANQAYIQNTALVFFTNSSGLNGGVTDLIERMRISPFGDVGIGTSSPKNKLDVKGKIRAEEVIIETGWADFVFDKDYHLRTLQDVENHINAYKHLPDIPSAKEVEENGVSLGEMQAKLLQKIEELTLYVIEHSKEIIQIKEENIKLKERLDTLIDTQ